jgi:hypothetical protein
MEKKFVMTQFQSFQDKQPKYDEKLAEARESYLADLE